MTDYFRHYFGYGSESDNYVGSLSHVEIPAPDVRLIAYYLPQFHPIDENNKWWGNGYTEWTGVTKARPQFVGHQQPRLPTELGFYDLRIPEVQERQAALAAKAGISAFCFYFYWFGGRVLMETPIRNFADNRNIDTEFCLCWANHDWTRPGRKDQVLIKQNYSSADDIALISHLSQYLTNPRYLRVDGVPLVMVWGPSLLPNAKETVRRWRDWCATNGVGPIHVCCNQMYTKADPADYGMDSATQFPPGDSGWAEPGVTRFREPFELLNEDYSGQLFEYRSLVAQARDFIAPEYRLFRAVCPSWDNEARRPGRGITFIGADPFQYREYLETALDQTQETGTNGDRLVFINAWNEWAEGAHLEPDQRFGFGYLEATRMASLRSVLKHVPPVEPERIAIVLSVRRAENFEQDLGWLGSLDIPYDVIAIGPPDLRQRLDEFATRKNLPLIRLCASDAGLDTGAFIDVLQSLDYRRYGRVLKLDHSLSEQGKPELATVIGLKRALLRLATEPELGVLGIAAEVTDDAETTATLGRLAARMGVMIEEDDSILLSGTCLLARTTALLPLATLGDLRGESERVKPLQAGRHKNKFADRILEQAVSYSARAANLTVSIFTWEAADP